MRKTTEQEWRDLLESRDQYSWNTWELTFMDDLSHRAWNTLTAKQQDAAFRLFTKLDNFEAADDAGFEGNYRG